jgi:hypothetical protein
MRITFSGKEIRGGTLVVLFFFSCEIQIQIFFFLLFWSSVTFFPAVSGATRQLLLIAGGHPPSSSPGWSVPELFPFRSN